MSKKNKVSSVKKNDKKASKDAKKNKVNKTLVKNKVAKNTPKKIVKKNEVKKIATKKPVKVSKTINKPTIKKSSKTNPIKTKVLTKTSAQKASITSKSKKVTVKPAKKDVKKIARPNPAKKAVVKKAIVSAIKKPKTISNSSKKVQKSISIKTVTAKKDSVIEKKVDTFTPALSKPELSTTKKKKEIIPNNDVIALNNTIPIKKENEISLTKIASISSAITNPIKKTESYSIKPEKEPNGKFELEFVIRASADLLYEFLYTQSGLSEWFCDDVNIRNGIYTFIWDGQMQQARLLKTIDNQLVRYQWVDKTDGSFFEFRLQHDDLTNDVSLMITDFAENNNEKDSSKLLWQSQVEKLMHVVGSI